MTELSIALAVMSILLAIAGLTGTFRSRQAYELSYFIDETRRNYRYRNSDSVEPDYLEYAVFIWNSGNQIINKSDLVGMKKISVVFSDSDFEICDFVQSNMHSNSSLSMLEFEAELRFEFLESRDGFAFVVKQRVGDSVPKLPEISAYVRGGGLPKRSWLFHLYEDWREKRNIGIVFTTLILVPAFIGVPIRLAADGWVKSTMDSVMLISIFLVMANAYWLAQLASIRWNRIPSYPRILEGESESK